MDISLIFTIISTVAASVWFLSRQLNDLHLSIDRINDALREYIIKNDHALNTEKDRITALKYNFREKLRILKESNDFQYNTLNETLENFDNRITDCELFLQKKGFVIRRNQQHKTPNSKYFESSLSETQGDFFFDDNESQIMENF